MPKDTGVVPLSFGGLRCRVRGRASASGEVVHDSLGGELGERKVKAIVLKVRRRRSSVRDLTYDRERPALAWGKQRIASSR